MDPLEILTIVTYVVTGASIILKALDIIAKKTPSTRDDIIVGRIKTIFDKILKVLEVLALNPKRKS